MMDLLDFVGKFHPLLVHFPIALILMAFGLDLVQKFKSNRPWKDTIKLLLVVGAVSAILAVACGWLLSRGGDYGAAIVDRHAMGGYITMVGSVLSAWLYHRDSRYAFVALSLTSVALGWTAHWGATITHGSQYFRMQISKPSQELHTAFLARIAGNTDSLADSDLDQLSVHARMIFADHCLQCHNSVKHKADLNLETEEGIRKGGESGPALMEGQPQQSELLRRVKLDRQNEESMPPEGEPLSASAVELLELWIAQGAPWADTTLKLFAEAPIWLEKPVLPDRDLAHPIDRFVDVYFDQEGTRWPKLCDDRTFIRRAYLDVVGILPSYEEVASFEQDEHPDKRSNLIDFLLGQNKDISTHWLSFWNDLLRNDYTGTGYITGGRKQITPWLFRSLAENKPYREMVRELINPSPESEGFIKGIQWRGVVNSSQSIEMQAAQNVAQSLLGTNLKCASCHNSFVNNLTLEQAYGFANVFADSSLELHQCDKPTGQHTLPSFLYPELGQVVGDSVVDRLASLADLITSEENGRFYRTFVNRIWAQLMGSGIVPSVDDMDAPPWSPALLDWLASHFIEENTDIRELIRTIMTSRTYQLETRPVKEQAQDSDQFEG
ncbi:MAG: DUF1549 domain-containing protein, partial [Saprospiraceae bacterium]|nr:DUF1549 domain-containing protein [Saprospiraceae bacterium]